MDVSVPAGYTLRIQPNAFLVRDINGQSILSLIQRQAFIATFVILACVSAIVRTVLRFYHLRKFSADDYFLFYAVLAAAATAGVAHSIKDLVYEQIYVGLYWQEAPPDFYDQMLVFEKRIQVCSFLIWSVIYAVKLSFLCLFRKLVDRIRALEIHWWIVTGITIACGLASMPLAFIICPVFTSDYMREPRMQTKFRYVLTLLEFCPIESQLYHERVYLDVTSALDVFTDVLIISVPVALLWRVRLSLRRKLTLGSMLCLSVAMIFMTIIRTSLAPLPNGIIDTSWLFFWQGMEAATAIIVLSLSAFRGLFGREGSRSSKRSKPLVYRPSNSDNKGALGGDQNKYEGLPEQPASTKAKHSAFSRYRGGSVMDEETQVTTTYDIPEMELEDQKKPSERSSSRLDQPFSEPYYSVAAYH